MDPACRARVNRIKTTPVKFQKMVRPPRPRAIAVCHLTLRPPSDLCWFLFVVSNRQVKPQRSNGHQPDVAIGVVGNRIVTVPMISPRAENPNAQQQRDADHQIQTEPFHSLDMVPAMALARTRVEKRNHAASIFDSTILNLHVSNLPPWLKIFHLRVNLAVDRKMNDRIA